MRHSRNVIQLSSVLVAIIALTDCVLAETRLPIWIDFCGTMAQPILSTNPQWAKDGWYQMPAVPGVVYADFRIAPPPHNWVWGKRHMIEFLIRLAEDWMFAFYDDQAKEFGNTAPIILGDVSPEGGVGTAA
jgi:hypothetical protein